MRCFLGGWSGCIRDRSCLMLSTLLSPLPLWHIVMEKRLLRRILGSYLRGCYQYGWTAGVAGCSGCSWCSWCSGELLRLLKALRRVDWAEGEPGVISAWTRAASLLTPIRCRRKRKLIHDTQIPRYHPGTQQIKNTQEDCHKQENFFPPRTWPKSPSPSPLLGFLTNLPPPTIPN